jgi:hypothetical protein
MIIVANSDLARVDPTTPKRATRLSDASVDPTEARSAPSSNAVGHNFRVP